MISKTIFSSLSLKSVATNSLLQESLACADTTLSLLYYVNRNVCRCVCAYTHIGVHVQRHTVNRTPSLLPLPPSFFLSLSLFLLHHSTPPEAKPAFLFIRLSLGLFYSLLFSSHSSPFCFSTFFCSSGGGSKTCQGVCWSAHGRCRTRRHQSVVVHTLMFSCVDRMLLWSEPAGTRSKCFVPKLNI